ncbi:MAG: DUF3846 domain-containing protein, partial [Ruminiclostridium sp.]|nr:DUF3846 domain-containing protein [Ruminiclostridium sp.]
MTVVMVEPGKPAYKTEIGTDLESLQKAVGGLIDIMELDNTVNLVFNDEGKLKILQIADIQDYAAFPAVARALLRTSDEKIAHDLNMLTGDNI